MYRFFRRLIIGTSTADVWLEEEIQAERAAKRKSEGESPTEVYDEHEWIRTRTLDDEILPADHVRRAKRLRAIWNYGSAMARESDLDVLTQEERDRLETIAIQERWAQFLGRPKGTDVRPGKYFP